MDESWDYIVVGAGSAGCVMAARLSESGKHRVLLLEAGGRDRSPWIHIPLGYGRTMFDPRVNWMFESEPEPHMAGRRIKVPRGKVLGGSSSINGLLYVRGQREDYDSWRDAGNPGWGYDEILPYFRKAENQARGADPWHGTGGPLEVGDLPDTHPLADAFVKAASNIGIPFNRDFNGAQQEGVGYFQATMRRGFRCSAARAYLKPALKRPNLRIVTDAAVTRILFDGLRAAGVAYRRDGVPREARAAREVILAAGAIQSPHLLQLSGVGPAALLRHHGIPVVKDLPGVGANLQDHIQTRLILECTRPITLNDDMRSWPRMAAHLLRYAVLRKGAFGWQAGLAGGFARTRPALSRPDVQFHFFAFSSDRVDPRLHPFPGFTISVCILRPESRGSVELRSPDPLARPAIRGNFLSAPGDVQTLLDGLKLTRRIARDEALARYVRCEREPGPDCTSDDALVACIREKSITVYHPVGTCKMGPDADAVVDSELRVHGVSGLRVVDASIMPSVTSGNTNAPAIAIGEKGADLVLARAEQANR
jgi:choline dehydrogenase